MSVKFPESIKVAGHVYKVIFPYEFRENKDLQAQADHVTLEIRVAAKDGGGCDYQESRAKENFLHELLHCILTYYGDRKYNDEGAVECTANGLFQVLTDNPELIKVFMKD